MKNSFQYVLLGIFGFFILAGVFVFASLGSFERGGDQQEVVGTATIWGTLVRSIVTTLVGRLAG